MPLNDTYPITDSVPDAVRRMLQEGYTFFKSDLPLHFSAIRKHYAALLVEAAEVERWIIRRTGETNLIEDPDEVDIGILAKQRDGRNRLPEEIELRHQIEGRLQRDKGKMTLHFAPRLIRFLRENGVDTWYYRELLDLLNFVHGSCEGLATDFAQELDRQIPGCDFFKRLEEAWFWQKTRLVNYRGEFRFHRDRNGLTFHIQSSDRGLWLLERTGELTQVDETSTQAIIVFPGKKCQIVAKDRAKIPATIHGGITPRGEEMNPRQSLVFFSHFRVTEEEWRENEMNSEPIEQERLLNEMRARAIARAAA